MRKKETPNPSRVRGRGVEVSETLFYASSDERSHGKFTAVLARTGNFVWLYEEHRDNDRTKFWSMSCSRNPRR